MWSKTRSITTSKWFAHYSSKWVKKSVAMAKLTFHIWQLSTSLLWGWWNIWRDWKRSCTHTPDHCCHGNINIYHIWQLSTSSLWGWWNIWRDWKKSCTHTPDHCCQHRWQLQGSCTNVFNRHTCEMMPHIFGLKFIFYTFHFPSFVGINIILTSFLGRIVHCLLPRGLVASPGSVRVLP